MTKRGCYREYLRVNNYKLVDKDNKGNFKLKWTGAGVEPTETCVVSWTAYRNFWNANYQNLKLGKSSEDICNLCHKIAMLHQFNVGTNDSALSDALFDILGETKDDSEEVTNATVAANDSVRGDSRAAVKDSSASGKDSEPLAIRGGGCKHFNLDLSDPMFLSQPGVLSHNCGDVQSADGLDGGVKEVAESGTKNLSHNAWRRNITRMRSRQMKKSNVEKPATVKQLRPQRLPYDLVRRCRTRSGSRPATIGGKEFVSRDVTGHALWLLRNSSTPTRGW